jgi:hypothetical protein
MGPDPMCAVVHLHSGMHISHAFRTCRLFPSQTVSLRLQPNLAWTAQLCLAFPDHDDWSPFLDIAVLLQPAVKQVDTTDFITS